MYQFIELFTYFMSINKKHNGKALSLVSNNKGGKISFTGDLLWLIENKPFQRVFIIMPLIHYRLRKWIGMIFLKKTLILKNNIITYYMSHMIGFIHYGIISSCHRKHSIHEYLFYRIYKFFTVLKSVPSFNYQF